MSTVEKHLPALLPRKDRIRFLEACTHVELALEQVLSDPGKPTKYVYFPTEGFISLISVIEGNPGVEVCMAGRKGMLGAQLALGVVTAPLHALVRGTGSAWRIGTRAFKDELAPSAAPTKQPQP